MHVDYLRKLGSDGELAEIQMINYHTCCEAMAERVENKTIEFGSRREEVYRNKLADVFIRVENGAQIIPQDGNPPKEGARASKNSPKENTDIALAYCPWCQAPVETHEIATV